jgi:hypothetical protein
MRLRVGLDVRADEISGGSKRARTRDWIYLDDVVRKEAGLISTQ